MITYDKLMNWWNENNQEIIWKPKYGICNYLSKMTKKSKNDLLSLMDQNKFVYKEEKIENLVVTIDKSMGPCIFITGSECFYSGVYLTELITATGRVLIDSPVWTKMSDSRVHKNHYAGVTYEATKCKNKDLFNKIKLITIIEVDSEEVFAQVAVME